MAKRVRLADVAKLAGVSPTSVSLVLSGRSRELRISESVQKRVLAAAAELQYRPNIVSVGLRTGTTRTIGFVSDTVATSRLAGDMIKGALEAAREHGMMLFIGETEGEHDLESGLLQAMHDRRVDGIILASMFTRAVDVPAALTTGPAVLLNAIAKGTSALSSIVPDELEAGRTAARVLLEAGHRNDIYVIGAGPNPGDIPPDSLAGTDRLAGIEEVFAAAGVAVAGSRGCADWIPEHGYAATKALLEQARPQALICINDRIAFGAYQALDDHALTVPHDVSVISFDDHPLAGWMRPQLTTIALPHDELGRSAVETLIAEIGRSRTGESSTSRTHRVPMPLRVRDSVAPPGD